MSDAPTLPGSLDFECAYRGLGLGKPEARGERLSVKAADLEALAREAFADLAFHLPARQLQGFAAILKDPEASGPERFVAASLIRNAVVAAEGIHPLCQDTGAALVYAWKGQGLEVLGGEDEEALARGAAAAYKARLLRASTLLPRLGDTEFNPGTNLPLHADIRAVGGSEYRFCFAAKGGGSANRTSLSMESPALLEGGRLEKKLGELVRALGVSGCPPYRISCVLGGLSPDEALYALALAGLGLLDSRKPLPGSALPSGLGSWVRDRGLEDLLERLGAESGLGAQFGGRHLCLDSRALRLPRHAASLPLALGVVCAAARSARAVVNAEGFWLEALETDPAQYLPREEVVLEGAIRIDLNRPLAEVAAAIGSHPAGTAFLLSGPVVTARDRAHARFAALEAAGQALPDYLFRYGVFYAGPTEAAPGQASGSFGPTTAGRMDAYLPGLLEKGASLLSIAKGGRSGPAAQAIAKAKGAAYLCAIGGAAALAARESVVSSRVIDYPDLGMEAVRLVELKDLPVILGIDGTGRDFYGAR